MRQRKIKLEILFDLVSPILNEEIGKRLEWWRICENINNEQAGRRFNVSVTGFIQMTRGVKRHVRMTLAEFRDAIGSQETFKWVLTGMGKAPKPGVDIEEDRARRQKEARYKQWDNRIREMIADGYSIDFIKIWRPTAWNGFLDRNKLTEELCKSTRNGVTKLTKNRR